MRLRFAFAPAFTSARRPTVVRPALGRAQLDRESISALGDALRSFAGAVLVVSHSAAFVDELCNERWSVEGGTVAVLKERRMEN